MGSILYGLYNQGRHNEFEGGGVNALEGGGGEGSIQ